MSTNHAVNVIGCILMSYGVPMALNDKDAVQVYNSLMKGLKDYGIKDIKAEIMKFHESEYASLIKNLLYNLINNRIEAIHEETKDIRNKIYSYEKEYLDVLFNENNKDLVTLVLNLKQAKLNLREQFNEEFHYQFCFHGNEGKDIEFNKRMVKMYMDLPYLFSIYFAEYTMDEFLNICDFIPIEPKNHLAHLYFEGNYKMMLTMDHLYKLHHIAQLHWKPLRHTIDELNDDDIMDSMDSYPGGNIIFSIQTPFLTISYTYDEHELEFCLDQNKPCRYCYSNCSNKHGHYEPKLSVILKKSSIQQPSTTFINLFDYTQGTESYSLLNYIDKQHSYIPLLLDYFNTVSASTSASSKDEYQYILSSTTDVAASSAKDEIYYVSSSTKRQKLL